MATLAAGATKFVSVYTRFLWPYSLVASDEQLYGGSKRNLSRCRDVPSRSKSQLRLVPRITTLRNPVSDD